MPLAEEPYQEATAYFTIEPKYSNYTKAPDGSARVEGARVVGVTQKPPEGRQRPGTIVTKLTIRIPTAIFKPLRPEAVIVLPEEMVLSKPIEVIAEHPGFPVDDDSEEMA